MFVERNINAHIFAIWIICNIGRPNNEEQAN